MVDVMHHHNDVFQYFDHLDLAPPKEPLKLPESPTVGFANPEHYIPDTGLIDAVKVALVLRKPLLLTGEPGTGKTSLAAYVATRLAYGSILTFNTKSTSRARELFYTYDALGRFDAIQTRQVEDKTQAAGRASTDTEDYIKFGALGLAILRTLDEKDWQALVRGDQRHALDHRGPSVVLIDEVDKAPRDFPNDILNEIDRMEFEIYELGNRKIEVKDKSMSPIVIITSNSEKDLPDAFLRRCIYFHIEFPPKETLLRIVAVRLIDGFGESLMVQSAVDFFNTLRDTGLRFQKKPGIAELLDWLLALKALGAKPEDSINANSETVQRALGSLLKTQDDLKEAEALLRRLRTD